MKVSIIGTVGLPANYGGFESLVEQLVRHNEKNDLNYTVYCSAKSYDEKIHEYHGARLKYVGLNANGVQSIPYDIISLIKASKDSDVILVLGVSGCSFLPIFRLFSRKRLIINIDGLEHQRDKWNKWARKFLKYSEAQAVKYADVIITDNKGITDYVTREYNKPSELIAYGGDHVIREVPQNVQNEILKEYGVEKGKFSLGICRIEPENNVHTILEAYSDMPTKKLIFIGNWQKNGYGMDLLEKYKDSPNISLKTAEYNLDKLFALRNNCELYLHGHSAGGTNPSLVEAMFFAKPIIAFDCVYNRESTENKASYFKNVDSLKDILTSAINLRDNAQAMLEIANRRYKWETIAKQYEALY